MTTSKMTSGSNHLNGHDVFLQIKQNTEISVGQALSFVGHTVWDAQSLQIEDLGWNCPRAAPLVHRHITLSQGHSLFAYLLIVALPPLPILPFGVKHSISDLCWASLLPLYLINHDNNRSKQKEVIVCSAVTPCYSCCAEGHAQECG